MITDRDPEFIGTITALYREELGRDPDPGGLSVYLDFVRNGGTGGQLRQILHDSPEGVAHRAQPIAPTVVLSPASTLHLEIRGSDFIDATGERLVLNGTDQFVAFRQYLDGVDLDPLFNESRELGFNLWRVFLMGSVRQNNILELRPNDGTDAQLRPFAHLLNAHGIALLATVFVDAQDVMPTVDDRQIYWQDVADALRGSLTLLSGGNQFPKNGWNPNELTDPGMLWSRGSALADPDPFQPQPNGASFAEFHPRRDLPASLLDSVASPVTLTRLGLRVPLIISEPLGFAEAERPGSRSNDANLAWRFARHYATECAGAVFHNDAGMRGQLMGPVTRACAEAWQRGMTI